MSGFSGTLALTGTNAFRLFTSTFNGSAAATFDLGTRGLTARQGSAYNLGALKGLAGSYLGMAGNSNSSSCTYTVGAANIDGVFAGVIANGSSTKLVHIVKTGTGTLTLAGVSTYTGTTTVNGGKLHVTGSLAATTTTVAQTGTLGGSGTIAGAVTCNGTLAPGNSAGTLTLTNGLALSSTSVLAYELGTISDRVNVTGNLTLEGTLNVTVLPGFGAGTYTVLTYTGTLDDNGLQLGALPAGYEASINTATSGQVRLVVSAILTPFEEWQVSNFGSTGNPDAAPSADPDSDGTSNETEFRLGLDPKDGTASFKATISGAVGGFTVTWPSAPGLVFEIRRSTTLGGPWELLDTQSSFLAGPASYTDTDPPLAGCFYQIALLP
jgi:fibronectin-binding autotransporter adhesin